MADVVEMIQLSPTMEEGIIVEWLKKEGDAVETGEILAEVETDKATMEMESFFDGTVLKILATAGEAAPIGSAIAIIGEEGEDITDLLAELEGGQGTSAGTGDDSTADEDDAGAKAADADSGDQGAADRPDEGPGDAESKASEAKGRSTRDDGRILSSPLARKIAEEHGLRLEDIEGSGPGGRIIQRDVEAAAREGRRPAATVAAPAAVVDAVAPGEDVPLSNMRKTIARRLGEAWQAPAFMLTREIDMGAAVAFRRQLNDAAAATERGVRISVNDLIVKAAALALLDVPEMNAAYQGDSLRMFSSADIGMAVSVDAGLVTPVVRGAHGKSLGTIARESRALIGKAKDRKLRPDDIEGATFSISNLGMFGIDHFTAVLNPPAAGILAVGQTRRVPVVAEDGTIGAGDRMAVTLTCDHRAVDGVVGARWLQAFAAYLEHPTLLVL
ncbi:MAG: 2-oxo acid dehydrogenase subunit E2 [Deltaproteobacteria bacterium]|nr:MAG: 2-oxo acid dehydrogenase subunit E2 [Deltaproteobacteria bacterium]